MSKRKLFIAISLLAIFIIASGQASQFARRIFQTFSDPATPCSRGSVYYHMLTNKFLICTNNGVEEVAVGAAGGVIPIANSSTTGRLSNIDWVIFNNKQTALGFTPENIANKDATNGYAGLVSGKIPLARITEVLSVLNLTDYSTSSGSGATAIKSTINSAATNDVLTWNGTNWINQAPLVFSVFGRSGIVTSQSGDYVASQITNAFDKTTANSLSTVTAPANPSVGFLSIWADTTDTILKVKNSAGTVAVTVHPTTCVGTDKVSAVNSDGNVICTPDQSGGGGGGGNLVSLNGLTASDQTFSTTNDTNIGLTISSVGAVHNFTMGWIGTLAKNRMVATTVHTDQTNTFGGFLQTFQAGALFKLIDPTTNTKTAQFDLSNIGVATTRTINIPDANSTTIQPSTAPSNNFANSISSQGVVGYSQLSFTNLSGSATDAQIPDSHTQTAIPNLTTNGFIKTGGGVGTLSVDTNTYITGNQTITLSGNVTGSGTTAITTTIGNNVINGAMIALGSDAQGDVIFYNGTDWARLPAGASGQILTTQGGSANPIWSAAGTGDVTLAGIQTFTGAHTFGATKLIIGTNAGAPSVVANSFYRDSTDGRLYIGATDGSFWHEILEAGVSVLNLSSASFTGVLPSANGGAGTINGILKANGSGTTSAAVAGTDYLSPTVFTGIPYDISTQIDSKPAISLQVLRYVAARSISLSSSGHACSAVTSATAQTDFVLAVNGSSKGTLRFAASGTTCTIVSGATATIVAGDIVTITAPATQDTTLADIAFTLKANLP